MLYFYSVRNDFTGLAIPALKAWKPIVIKAMNMANAPAIINTHQPIEIRYAKSCNHLFMKYQASGAAMIKAITTSFKKSFDNNFTITGKVAPRTFRIPIYFVR